MKKLVLLLILTTTCIFNSQADFNLELTHSTRWKGQYYDLAIDGNMLFLANKLGIEIYSIESAHNPQALTFFFTDGLANGVAVNMPYIYVGDVYGFSVWDISDIDSPIKRGSIRTNSETGFQERLYYRDGFVYIAAYTSGIQIIDVSDPDNPVLAGGTKTNAYAWDLVLTDQAAYIMDFFSMSIVDIRRPRFPVNRVTVDAMFASGATARDNLLYLGYVDGLRIMDISDPFNPVDVSDIGPTGSGTAETVALNGNHAIVGHGSYIEIYDVSDPHDPVQISYFYPPGHPRKLLTKDDVLFTILDDNGFQITDISDPEHPTQIQHVDTGIWGSRNDVTIVDNMLFLSDWNRGLVVYQVDATGNLTEIANYAAPGTLRDFVIQNNIIWLVCQSEIQAVDISDPLNMVFLDRFQTTGSPQNISIIGTRLYLCDLYGLYILDISDPGNIIRIGAQWLAKEGNPYDIEVIGNYGFTANGWKGMTVIDLTDESDPDPVIQWPGDNSKSYISVYKNESGMLYFLNPSQGIDILDVSNPMSPVLTTTIPFGDLVVNDFVIQETTLFLAAGEDGIFAWDIKNPEAPQLMAAANTPGDALGIDADDSFIYVADEFDLALYSRDTFATDIVAPEILVQSPSFGQRLTEKTILITGTASDADSGIRSVEISVNEGQSWNHAFGQESWSILVFGKETGALPVQARATDWSGNVSPVTEIVWVYNDPPVPRILMAGFDNSYIVSGQESIVKMSALVQDPWDPVYLKDLTVYLNGQPTTQKLELISETSGFGFYQLQYTETFTGSGNAAYGFSVTDVYGNRSNLWPEIPNKW